jgi:hypothetical protein
VANLKRNEAVKLFASAFNTLATSVMTVGILTPIGTQIYNGALRADSNEVGTYMAICIIGALVLHCLAQVILLIGLRDTP